MIYGIFSYNHQDTNKTANILFEVELLPKEETTIKRIHVKNDDEIQNVTDTLDEILHYMTNKFAKQKYLIKRLATKNIPEWLVKYIKFNENFEHPIYGKCLQVTHTSSGLTFETIEINNTFSKDDCHIFEAEDDESALLLMECSEI